MNAKPLQVWLVDDDASIRWVLEKALKGNGMIAKTFDQADNALSALRADTPDVLMTDIRMPGRSGLDLLKEIQGSRPGLPVIVMTAHSDLDAAVAVEVFHAVAAFSFPGDHGIIVGEACHHCVVELPIVLELIAACCHGDTIGIAHAKRPARDIHLMCPIVE